MPDALLEGGFWLLRRTFAGDEADEFADAFLHALFGLFGDFGVVGEGLFHDSGNWRKVSDVSIGHG